VNRDQAEQVFALVADLHGELRERLVTSRWWLIWAIMGVQTLAACCVSQYLLWTYPQRVFIHHIVWLVHITILLLVIRLVHRRIGGQRTARERLLWVIWLGFLFTAVLITELNDLLGLPPFKILPIAPVLATFAFIMTAFCIHPAFWVAVGIFLADAFVMVKIPEHRFLIWGLAWFITLESIAIGLRPHRASEASPL
jgi:hypothetical protein